jgi:Domain of unknown function DUF29
MTTQMNAQQLYDTYDIDLYLWSQENAKLLKQKLFNEIDIEHLIEEIEDMGKSEKRNIFSHLKNLIMHLLKWEYQSDIQSNSWRYSIRNARLDIARLIKESPSLKNTPKNELLDAYSQARELASDETGLNIETFPEECQYTIEDILTNGWFPK